VGQTAKRWGNAFEKRARVYFRDYISESIVHVKEERLCCIVKGSSGGIAQKTSIPPPITPKRTAAPVVRMVVERLDAPPLLLPPEALVLEGDGEPELEPEGLLLVREDRWDATLDALERTEDKLEVTEEMTEEELQRAASIASASVTSAGVHWLWRHDRTACW